MYFSFLICFSPLAVYFSPYHSCVFLYFPKHREGTCIGILISVFTFSIIWVISVPVSIEWLFFLVINLFYIILECLVIFDWMLHIVNFTLIGVKFCYVSRNIIELYLDTVSLLRILWSFRDLCLNLIMVYPEQSLV